MALAIDGGAGGVTGNGTGVTTIATSAGLTAATAGDIVLCGVTTECVNGQGGYCTVSSITDNGPGLSFVRRGQVQVQGGSGPFVNVELWWAYASATFTNVTFTVHLTGKTLDDGSIGVQAIKGFTGGTYPTNPWDIAASVVGSSSPASLPSVTMSSNSAATMFIGVFGSPNGGTPTVGTIGGTTATEMFKITNSGGTNFSQLLCQFLDETSIQTNIVQNCDVSTTNWCLIGDVLAVVGGPGTAVTHGWEPARYDEHPLPRWQMDESRPFFLPSQIPVPSTMWMSLGDKERPPPIQRPPDEATPFFRPRQPQTWLPITGEEDRPPPIKRPPDEPPGPWFVRSPSPVPTSWLPTTGQEDRSGIPRSADERMAFVKAPAPVGISGIAWWQPAQVQLPPPLVLAEYTLAWGPQVITVVVSVTPPQEVTPFSAFATFSLMR